MGILPYIPRTISHPQVEQAIFVKIRRSYTGMHGVECFVIRRMFVWPGVANLSLTFNNLVWLIQGKNL